MPAKRSSSENGWWKVKGIEETSRVLDYQGPTTQGPKVNPLLLTLLCLPPVLFWASLPTMLALGLTDAFVVIPRTCVALTVISLVISVVGYQHLRPKPWGVVLCRYVNAIGLLSMIWLMFFSAPI